MTGRPKVGDDSEDWADMHCGECAMGSITELRSADPPGRPFEFKRAPMGYNVDPAHYGKKKRKSRKKT